MRQFFLTFVIHSSLLLFVSNGEQNLDLQRDALPKAGCERIFTDEMSGTKSERPVLSEAFKFIRTGDSIDTTSPAGKLQFHIFSALTEFERDLIRERTMAGLRAARARGRTGGRKQQMTPEKIKVAASLMKDKSNTVNDICRTLKVSRATLYRYISPIGEVRKT